ncbi:MAG: hypothetical protein P8X57_14105 [Cyclobacteriaceae bacterium]
MNTRIRNKLVQLARTDPNPVSYRRLIVTADLGLNMEIKHEKQLLGEILDEISESEYAEDRPLLSALVKNGKNGQDDRFFKMCERLGMGEWKDLKKDKSFKKKHIKACHEFWADDKNYKKYF